MKNKIVRVERNDVQRRCVRPAELALEDTGEVEIANVRGEDGIVRSVERPVKRQVQKAAQFVEDNIKTVIYQVFDGTDTHEFVCRKAAQRFLKGA